MAKVRLSLVLPEGLIISFFVEDSTHSSSIPKYCSHNDNHSKRKQDSTVDFSHGVHTERTNQQIQENETVCRSFENIPGGQSSEKHRVEHIFMTYLQALVLGYQVNM